MVKLRVLHVIFSLRTGGAETMLVDIVNHQCRRADVTLLVINNEIDPEIIEGVSPDVEVKTLDRTPGKSPLYLMFRLNRIILKSDPDIIHIHNHNIAPLIRIKRKNIIFTVHDIGIPMIYTSSLKMCAISEAVKADILSRCPKASVEVVMNGIESFSISDRGVRSKGKHFRIVQVARLDSNKKGQDILISALNLLTKAGYDASVTFIGDGKDQEVLRNQAVEAGVADKVIFEGKWPRKEIYRRLCEFDAMCHPARYEGFGLTVVEGAVAGLPLLVPDEGGPFELTFHGEYATIFKKGDIDSCAKALMDMIDNYNDKIITAREARDVLGQKYSVNSMVDKYFDIYLRHN